MPFEGATGLPSVAFWVTVAAVIILAVSAWVLVHRVSRLKAALVVQSDENARLKSELHVLAMTDELTQLRNEHYLQLMVSGEIKRLKRLYYRARETDGRMQQNRWSGLLAIAPDYLEHLKKEFGEAAEARVWRHLATYLQQHLRETDIVTRVQETCFVVFLPNVGFSSLGGVAEKLLRNIRALRVEVQPGKMITCTCSMGYCLFPYDQRDGHQWQDVLRLAQVALGLAQNCGRDKAVGLDYAPDVPFLAALEELVKNPRQALDRGVFRATSLV